MDVVSFMITAECSISIAFNLFVLEFIDNVVVKYMAFLNISMNFEIVFAYFYLSERITTDLLSIGDLFYNSTWYQQLSAKQQKCLTVSMIRSQCEIRLTGFGIVDCSLITFSKVS